MPIYLIDTLKPKNDGTFPMVEDADLKGGFRVVYDVNARDAIPTEHRTEGMLVYTTAESSFWRLGPGLENGDWSGALAERCADLAFSSDDDYIVGGNEPTAQLFHAYEPTPGTLTAPRQLIFGDVPPYGSWWIVWNECGQDLSVLTESQVGAAPVIPAGSFGLVKCVGSSIAGVASGSGGGGGGFTAGGDLTGNSTSQTVSKLKGLPVSAGSTAEHADAFQAVLSPVWPSDAPVGLAFDGTSLWTLDSYTGSNNVRRINVTDISGSMTVAATIETEEGYAGSWGRLTITTDSTHVYVTTGDTKVFYVISKSSNEVVGKGRIDLGEDPSGESVTGIAVNGDNIIVLSPDPGNLNSHIYKFSKSDVLSSWPAEASHTDHFISDDLPGDGAAYFIAVTYGGGFFWVSAVTTDPIPRLYKLDASSMTIVDSWYPLSLTSEGAVAVHYAFGSVWMATGQGKYIYRFNPSDLAAGATAEIDMATLGDYTSYLASDSTHLWASCEQNTTIARISTGTGTEAITGLTTYLGGSSFQIVYDTLNNSAWVAVANSGVTGENGGIQRLTPTIVGGFQPAEFYAGPHSAEWLPPFVKVRTIFSGLTLVRSDRYVLVDEEGPGPTREYVFLPESPTVGQKHTIVSGAPLRISLHGNGNMIDYNGSSGDGLPSIPLYFDASQGSSSGLSLPIQTPITVVWEGDRWRTESFGGENFALQGEVQGSRRNTRVSHIGGYKVKREGIAPIGHALAVVQGSQPKALFMVSDKLFVFREGLTDIFKYDPTTKQRIDRTLPFPSGWVNPVACASSTDDSIWVAESGTGRIAQVTISTSPFADSPSITRMLISKYQSTQCMALDEWNGGVLISTDQSYLAKFDEETHIFTQLANDRGYSSMAAIEGFGYGIAKPSGYSAGRLEKFDLETGDILSFASPPSPGSSGGMTIGTQVGDKLIIPDSVSGRIFRYDLTTDDFDSTALDVSAEVDGPAFTAWNGTNVIVAGKNEPGSLVQITAAGDPTPAIGDSLTIPGTQFTGLFYDTVTSAHIVSDKLGDKLYHFEPSLSLLPPPGEAAGLLAVTDIFASPVVTGTPVYKGSRTTIQSIHTEIQTSATTEVECGTFAIPANTSVAFDIIVTSRRETDNTKRGRWKFSALVSRTATGSAVLDVLDVGSAFNLNAGMVTCELDSNDFKVLVTPADTDDRNWDSEMCVRVGDAT